MGVDPFTLTFARQKAVDFTESFFEEPQTILIPAPVEETRLLSCARPFQSQVNRANYILHIKAISFLRQVWIALALLILLLPLIIWALSKCFIAAGLVNINPIRLKQHFIFVYGVLLTQCNNVNPLTNQHN